MSEAVQPIIVKRVKKGGHGHHGGAWKVAFADFVTAMMAFFLLLWLVASTTQEQRAGISDYFQNPSSMENAMGASNVAVDLGGGVIGPVVSNPPPTDRAPEMDEDTLVKEAREVELKQLEALKDKIEESIDANQELKQFKDQLLMDIVDEGLRIQIVDKENRPMFDSGSATLKPYTKDILAAIVQVIREMPNKISLTGHTDQAQYVSKGDAYSNWELSADRANAARRALLASGLPEENVGRVVGLGSSMLFVKDDPLNPQNRRISLVVMNKQAEEKLSDEGKESPDEGL